jgi:hypothetical protein
VNVYQDPDPAFKMNADHMLKIKIKCKILMKIKSHLNSRDFQPLVFFRFKQYGTPGSPDSWANAVLNIDSNSRRNSIRFF